MALQEFFNHAMTTRNVPSPFLDPSRWIGENEHAVAVRDLRPVTRGHTLVVPRREVTSIFELSAEEMGGCWALLGEMRSRLDEELQPDGYNVGINVGTAAGQSVAHAHIHLIPRLDGDHDDPRGGVRAVIPAKQRYAI